MKSFSHKILVILSFTVLVFTIISIFSIHKQIVKVYDKNDLGLNFELERDASFKIDSLLQEVTMLKQKLLLTEMKFFNCQIQKEKHNFNFIEPSSHNLSHSKKFININFENESDLDPYTAFTIDKIFPAELGIYKRNVVKMSGPRRDDIHATIELALEHLNQNKTNNKLNKTHFSNGFYRSTFYNGFEYELYFKRRDFTCCLSLKLNRPLEHLRVTHSNRKVSKKQVINFILPLTSDLKSLNAFRLFISSFETVAVNQDKLVTLTIVFGTEVKDQRAKNEMNTFLSEFKERSRFDQVNVVNVEMKDVSSFSRAKLLQIGSNHEKFENESLLFFCDVDVLFNKNFLDMCRLNAVKNERVFFPILYSFYNPYIVKNHMNTNESNLSSNEDVETARVSLIINKETGYWRDTGFGMVCLCKEDFKTIGGFDDEFTRQDHWGGEDLHLYRKFLKTKMSVYRAVVPGLFHLYHEKICNKNKMNALQFRNCVMSKILNEASQKHFGIAYLNITNLGF